MRVVIVGAGISGLSCYLFLQKHLLSVIKAPTDLEIIILESHAATSRRDASDTAFEEAAAAPGPFADTIGAAIGLGT